MARSKKIKVHPAALPIALKPGETLIEDGLNWNQRQFVFALMDDECRGDKVKAAMKARPDMNEELAAAWAYSCLNKPTVQRAIAIMATRQYGSAEWAIKEVVAMSHADVASFATVDEKGDLKVDWGKALELGAIGSLKGIKQEKDGTLTPVLHDRKELMELILRYHGKLSGEDPAPKAPVTITVNVHTMGSRMLPAEPPIEVKALVSGEPECPPSSTPPNPMDL